MVVRELAAAHGGCARVGRSARWRCVGRPRYGATAMDRLVAMRKCGAQAGRSARRRWTGSPRCATVAASWPRCMTTLMGRLVAMRGDGDGQAGRNTRVRCTSWLRPATPTDRLAAMCGIGSSAAFRPCESTLQKRNILSLHADSRIALSNRGLVNKRGQTSWSQTASNGCFGFARQGGAAADGPRLGLPEPGRGQFGALKPPDSRNAYDFQRRKHPLDAICDH